VNQDVMSNPRVNVRIGDGREVLLTSRRRYDLIVSEPSNPYRAGVASLFTSEFYRAAASRLTNDGLFLQWVQAYEIDFRTLHTVYATICREFPSVETWMTQNGDFLLVGSRQPILRNADLLRARMLEEPFKSAIANAWGATNLEGVLARFIGNRDFSRFLAGAGPKRPNTDDRTLLEYYFARQAGGPNLLNIDLLRQLALQRQEHLPGWSGRPIDSNQLMLQRASMRLLEDIRPPTPPREHPLYARAAAMNCYIGGDYTAAYQWWRASGTFTACDLTELAMVADVLANADDPAAPSHIEALRPWRPAEAGLVLARLRLRRGELPAAAAALEGAFEVYRRDPWTWLVLAERSLPLAVRIAEKDPALAERMFAALEAPFSVYCLELPRLETRLDVAHVIEGDAPGERTRAAIDAFGRHVPWTLPTLAARAGSYARLGDPRAEEARRELRAYMHLLPPQPYGPDGAALP
jgi:hypothetical protein